MDNGVETRRAKGDDGLATRERVGRDGENCPNSQGHQYSIFNEKVPVTYGSTPAVAKFVPNPEEN